MCLLKGNHNRTHTESVHVSWIK